MTRRNRAKSSSLFLLELILAILFFSIASAVCVQFFVKSHLLSQEARELNVAATEASSVAELISVSEDAASAIDFIQTEYPYSEVQETSRISIYYDDGLLPCNAEDARYCLRVDLTQKDNMLTGTLNMTKLDGDDSIYSLDVSHHLQRRAGHGI